MTRVRRANLAVEICNTIGVSRKNKEVLYLSKREMVHLLSWIRLHIASEHALQGRVQTLEANVLKPKTREE